LLDQAPRLPLDPSAGRARLVSLALINDESRETIMEFVAMLTLLEQRASGQAVIGESLVLALD
jgi:hypothetical protein